MTMRVFPAQQQVDVLVIGAGPAGAAVTARLAERGAEVLCLEQGDWIEPSQRPKASVDWEVRGRRWWHPSPAVRRGTADYPVASRGEDPIDVYMYSAVGGSAIGYGGHFWRFQPSDFRTRSLDGFGVDWPITYEDLAPYYALNETIMGTSGLRGDPTGPPRDNAPLPPLPVGKLGRRWIAGFERLGWYWWVQEQAIVSQDYDGRPACKNRGFCTLGCPDGSLSTPDVTYWPRALRAGAELRVQARVREIALRPDGRVRGALYYGPDGALHEARARVVVLCCNGIGTPRLLLMSTSSRHPHGLANSSGLVGANLMVHVQSVALGRFEEDVEAYKGARGSVVASRHFYETDPANDFVRGFIISAMRGNSPLNVALGSAPWGPGHHAALERTLAHEGAVWICGDDPPEAHNRVELDWQALDDFGLPGVRTSYRLADNSQRLGVAAIRRAREFLDACGATEIRDTGLSPVLGWHLLGTARMGDDPATSVVDAENRAHDAANLFIVDSSSFPTGGAVNPTNTIQALALRAADAIWARRAEW
jgi:choline dehydrogenase-like flavoprotein